MPCRAAACQPCSAVLWQIDSAYCDVLGAAHHVTPAPWLPALPRDCAPRRHALPPGYVLKSQMKELLEQERANAKDIAEVIEEERAKVDARTPITEEVRGARGRHPQHAAADYAHSLLVGDCACRNTASSAANNWDGCNLLRTGVPVVRHAALLLHCFCRRCLLGGTPRSAQTVRPSGPQSWRSARRRCAGGGGGACSCASAVIHSHVSSDTFTLSSDPRQTSHQPLLLLGVGCAVAALASHASAFGSLWWVPQLILKLEAGWLCRAHRQHTGPQCACIADTGTPTQLPPLISSPETTAVTLSWQC
jgi:hypothetical protein